MTTERAIHLNQGKNAALVVPLDSLRTIDFNTKTFISGEYPGSGIMYIGVSGKQAFVTQMIVNNLSGIFPVRLRFADAATAQSGFQISGNAYIVDLAITSGMTNMGTYVQTFTPALGPYVSGVVTVSGFTQIGGNVTTVTQLDPTVYQ